ncbi:hypothetical protein PCO87_15705 [Pectobacteriaceae bacterium C52]|nr:hypothetical protein PCO87_15705 [Pectobacteriaceae bacterium C52]WJY16368.1 hypothetical protein PCO82_06830 [Pectobacteriaceae bacterium CE90]
MTDDFQKYHYAWEKFHGAMHTLATDAPIKQRIVNAYVFNILHVNRERDIPKTILSRYDELINLITSVEPESNEGRVEATVHGMDEIKCNRTTELMIGLYDDLCRFMPNHYA